MRLPQMLESITSLLTNMFDDRFLPVPWALAPGAVTVGGCGTQKPECTGRSARVFDLMTAIGLLRCVAN